MIYCKKLLMGLNLTNFQNQDETGAPLSSRPPKIIAKKGQKKVR